MTYIQVGCSLRREEEEEEIENMSSTDIGA